ncbi:MAG: hypothetical protein AAFY60_18435 [Myxococcota bacterium]
MALFMVTLGFMLVVVFAMSIGVMITGRRLKGSCGGIASGSCACKEQGIEPGQACANKNTPAQPSLRIL